MPGKRAQLAQVAWISAMLFGSVLHAAEAGELVIDCSKPLGEVRTLNGVNGGPLEDGGLLDLSEFHRQAGFPLTRLHDIHWPNPDVADIHVVFPNLDADPTRPESYDFVRTDEYLRATLATGTKLVYRLGESIEHTETKRHVHPPRDPEKWAAACEGIIRHYNEGWAGGFRHDIRYWEIWNEPDNRPAMWTGNDEEYFRLYATAAKRIKARWPGLKVGGPAVGNTGELVDGKLRTPPFVTAFLGRCRRDELPLDFFSWHVYTNDSREVATRAREVRRLLDGYGFTKTESHLNEWNYLPDKDWTPVGRGGQGAARQRFYERLGGAEGAAFVAATLVRLQDEPLDAACYFNATSNGFGLFNPSGVPKKNYRAFMAFRMFADGGRRVEVAGSTLVAAASVEAGGDAVTLLVCNESPKAVPAAMTIKGLRRAGAASLKVWTLDARHDLEETECGTLAPGQWTLERTVPGHSVTVIQVSRPAPAAAPPGR